jgi:hypothetical protein
MLLVLVLGCDTTLRPRTAIYQYVIYQYNVLIFDRLPNMRIG